VPPTPELPALLVARGLLKRRGGRPVVQDVDIDVFPGEVVGLLGPNGAGKSSTFHLLTGRLQADGGTVVLAGQALTGLPLWQRARRGLGYLPQEPSLLLDLTAVDNLCLALEARGARPQDARREARARLDRVGLAELGDRPARSLSGGEARRVEIARCLAGAPSVLLLDEPFSGVDPVAVSALQALIRELAASGMAVLLTDHAVHATLPICDRAIVLVEGRTLAQGPPAVLAADPHVRARFLGPDFRLPA
jgi:lipopolysaccharide export system ATP-binding protein